MIRDEFSFNDLANLQDKIKELMVKALTLAPGMVQPTMKQLQPDSLENSSCFQIISFDIMVDQDFKPYLLELNDLPHLYSNNLLETEIKRVLVTDAFKLLCLNMDRKNVYHKEREIKMYN